MNGARLEASGASEAGNGAAEEFGAAFPVPGAAPLATPGNADAHDRPQAARQSHPIFWMRAASPTLSVNAQPGASAKAILSEIRSCAERLIAHGESSSIDLRFLKSMPDERATLARLLGRGEVSAVVDSIGRSEIEETGIPCVWWVRHLNSEDEMVGELIEIADIPELLVGDREAVALGLEALRAREAAIIPNTPPGPQAR